MKKLKKAIEKENAELLEEDRSFLENTLIPKAQANRVANKKANRIIPVTGCLLCCIVVFVLFAIFLFPPKNDFDDTYKSSKSELSEVNENLTFTQMAGEYSSIEKTYKISDVKAVSFFLVQNRVETETEILSCKFNLIIDREYKQDDPDGYDQQSEYLDYTLYYRRTVTTGEFNIYQISAYMDTGAEQYFIEYERWSVEQTDNFIEFLSTKIKNKAS